jgi:hypothetical protein
MPWLIVLGIAAGGVTLWEVVKRFTGATKTIVTPGQHPATPMGDLGNGPGTLVNKVATTGIARAAAMTLYQALKSWGANPAAGTQGAVGLMAAVSAFQAASNTDPDAKSLTGPLPTTGKYDARTSAALTMYTQDPIAASSDAPPPTPPAPGTPAAVDYSTPGDAATAGYNLYMYLKAHGDDHSADEQILTQSFQQLVNTDPKYPGPAGALKPIIISKPLSVTSIYDAPTAAALAVVSGNSVAPGSGPF